MKTTIIKLFHKSYSLHQAGDPRLAVLADFLTSDVGCGPHSGVSFFRNWANNPEETRTGGNLMDLEKEEGGSIVIYNQFAKELNHKEENVFRSSVHEFLKILNRWEEICKSKSNIVIISREGDTIKLESAENCD